MTKLSDTETLIKFRKWLHRELSSTDTEYAFIIDQIGGILHHIQEFDEMPSGCMKYNDVISLGKTIKSPLNTYEKHRKNRKYHPGDE